MELINFLQKCSLDEKEAKIYLTLLEFGPSPASVIASKIKLKRTTIYYILDELIKKGFVKKTIKHNISYFNPLDPQFISQHIDDKIFKLNTLKKDLKTQLAVLQTLHNKPTEKPKITYYEGNEGTRKAYEDILTSKSEVLEIDLPDDIHSTLGEDWVKEFVKKRIAKKIFLKAIIPDTHVALDYVARDPKEYRHAIALPKELNLKMHSSISIYDDKINIISLKKNSFGIIIENEFLATTMKTLYKLAWENAAEKAKKYQKRRKAKITKKKN